MKIGLNIPTTYRIASQLLQEIAGFGFEVIRTDVPPEGPLDQFVGDYASVPGLIPLFLLHNPARNEPLLDVALDRIGHDGFMIQVYNEPPGMDHVNLSEYIKGILDVHRDCRARGFTGPILMGGLANPSLSNRDWLKTALEVMPQDVVVDEHRYSYKTQDDWRRPWPPFVDRQQEATSLAQIAGSRAMSLTETGWHTAAEMVGLSIEPDGPDPDPFPDLVLPYTIRLTDEQCRDNLVKDFMLYSLAGYDLLCVYQLNDGEPDTAQSRYGIRRLDGSWKPQASAVKIWRGL